MTCETRDILASLRGENRKKYKLNKKKKPCTVRHIASLSGGSELTWHSYFASSNAPTLWNILLYYIFSSTSIDSFFAVQKRSLYVIENPRVYNPRIVMFNPRIIQSHIMSLLCPSDQELFCPRRYAPR